MKAVLALPLFACISSGAYASGFWKRAALVEKLVPLLARTISSRASCSIVDTRAVTSRRSYGGVVASTHMIYTCYNSYRQTDTFNLLV